MSDDSLPAHLFIAAIIAIMIINALVVASKRALDFIDRNVIKDMLEDDPDNKKLKKVTDFLAKPSKYHYADHAASFISIIVSFALFNAWLVFGGYAAAGDTEKSVSWPVVLSANLVFYILYTAISDIFPKKLAAQSSESTGIRLVGFQNFIYCITWPLVVICKGIANIFLQIAGKDTDVDDSYFSEDKVMSMLDRGQESGDIKEEGRKMIDSNSMTFLLMRS